MYKHLAVLFFLSIICSGSGEIGIRQWWKMVYDVDTSVLLAEAGVMSGIILMVGAWQKVSSYYFKMCDFLILLHV